MAEREIRFYKNYFKEFFIDQEEKTRRKILQVLSWIQTIDRLPVRYLKVLRVKQVYMKLGLRAMAKTFGYFVVLIRMHW